MAEGEEKSKNLRTTGLTAMAARYELTVFAAEVIMQKDVKTDAEGVA